MKTPFPRKGALSYLCAFLIRFKTGNADVGKRMLKSVHKHLVRNILSLKQEIYYAGILLQKFYGTDIWGQMAIKNIENYLANVVLIDDLRRPDAG